MSDRPARPVNKIHGNRRGKQGPPSGAKHGRGAFGGAPPGPPGSSSGKRGSPPGGGAPSPQGELRGKPVVAAHRVLRSFDPTRDRLPESVAEASLALAQDKAIAGALADGCVRHGVLLDLLISHGSTTKPSKMERAILAAARLGVLQHLRGVPAHAAVSESVALLPAGHRARGLVNAVVRRVTETVTSRPLATEEREAWIGGNEAARERLCTPRTLPFQNRWLLTSEFPIFPATMPERMRLIAGLPEWLERELLRTLEADELSTLCLAMCEPPGTWIRAVGEDGPSALTRVEDAARSTDSAEIVRVPAAPRARLVPRTLVPSLLSGEDFRAGRLTIQDYAAQLPAMAARVAPGMLCLDLCAAPGGKTAQLAEYSLPGGRVVAVDVSGDRLMRVKETVSRLGLANTNGMVADARDATFPDCGKFDVVLVDAPCSNTGVMGRRVEVKWRLTASDLTELRGIQLAILANAARHAKPGGKVAYSTCSLLDSENGALVREFLEGLGGEAGGWRMDDERLTLPTPGGHDGGYYAVLRKPS